MPIRTSACVLVLEGVKLQPITASTPLDAFRKSPEK
jgi:hypothetical protein